MTKLRRVYETVETEARPLEEVALERYGSMEAFNEALEERRWLDERDNRKASRGGSGKDRERRGDDGRRWDEGEKNDIFNAWFPQGTVFDENKVRTAFAISREHR